MVTLWGSIHAHYYTALLIVGEGGGGGNGEASLEYKNIVHFSLNRPTAGIENLS